MFASPLPVYTTRRLGSQYRFFLARYVWTTRLLALFLWMLCLLASILETPIAAAQTRAHDGVGFPYDLYPPNHYGPPRRREDNIMREGALRPGVPNPELLYPRGPRIIASRGFVMTHVVQAPQAKDMGAEKPTAIARANQIPGALSQCWRPLKDIGAGQITVRLAFSADGSVLAHPLVTYVAANDKASKERMRATLLDAIKQCAPLPITASLGQAIAGRPFAIRFIVEPPASQN